MSGSSRALKRGLVLASLLAVAGLAQAQSGGYVQAGVGRSDLDIDCEGLAECDSTGNALMLAGGWRFGGGLAAEGLYVNFGKAKFRDTVFGVTVNAELKASLLGGGVAYSADFGNGLGGVVRLGLGRVNAKATASAAGVSESASDNATGLYLGLGATYAFSKSVAAELGYLRARAKFEGDSGTVSTFTVGVRFDF